MFKDVKYLLTTHDLAKMPNDDLAEIVIVGKSNVGKSTFINLLTNHKKLAYISSKPGKTRAVSFFLVNDGTNQFRLVDVPGYGYASVSKTQKAIFAKTLDDYFSKRKNIKIVILLIDIRNLFSKLDLQMIEYLNHYQIKFVIIGTKLDKTNQSQQYHFVKLVKEEFNQDVIMFSAVTKKNLDAVLALFSTFSN